MSRFLGDFILPDDLIESTRDGLLNYIWNFVGYDTHPEMMLH